MSEIIIGIIIGAFIFTPLGYILAALMISARFSDQAKELPRDYTRVE